MSESRTFEIRITGTTAELERALSTAQRAAERASDAVTRGMEGASAAMARAGQAAGAAARQYEVSFRGVEQAAARAQSVMERINQATGVSRGGDGMRDRAADLQAYGAALDATRAKFNPLFAAGQRYKETLAEIRQAHRAGALSEAEMTAALERTKAAFTQQVAAIRGVAPAMKGAADAARLTTREMQLLSPQLADIGVSLAGGMNPLLVLIQQGPQITDAVGGVGRAFALLRASIHPAAAAAAAAAIAIGAMIAIGERQERALAGLSNRLRATRDDYQQLAGSVEAAARAAAATTSLGTDEARQAGQRIASQRNFGGSQQELRDLIALSGRLATVMGTETAEAADRLAAAIARPTEAARRMAEDGLRTMDEGLLRTIQRLENQGRVSEAAAAALGAYRRAADATAKTPLQQATEQLSQAFTRLWQAMKPAVDAIGSALASGVAFLVRQVAALADGLARIAAYLNDTRVGRFLFGEPAQAPAAQPQRSATEIAMERVRQINPRSRQQQDIRDQTEALRRGLQGASPEQTRQINDAIHQLQTQLQGLSGPMSEHLRQLRQQGDLAQFNAGAARELAAAEQAVREAARQDGGTASPEAIAEAQLQVRRRLTGELLDQIAAIEAATRATNAEADATALGGRAASDAAIAVEAATRARAYAVETADDYEVAVNQITQALRAQRDAQQALRDAQAIRDQDQQLEMLARETELLGQSVEVRERELAILRERQRVINEGGDPDSEAGRRRVENAARIADATRELQRQRAVLDEIGRLGEQAFDRIGEAITQAFVDGRKAMIDFRSIGKAIFSELVQAALRLAVLNPVRNWVLGTNAPTIFDLPGRVVGGVSTAAPGSSGFGGLGNLVSGIGSLFGFGGGGGVPLAGANGMLAGGQGQSLVSAAGGLGGLGSLAGGTGSLSGALGALGAGFAGGVTIGTLLAGDSQARQTNALIGAGIGTVLLGPFGGLAGGALGGLIGPGRAFKGGDAYAGVNSKGLLEYDFYRGKNFDQSSELIAQTKREIDEFNAAMTGAGLRFKDWTRDLDWLASVGGGESPGPKSIAESITAKGGASLMRSDNATVQRALDTLNDSTAEAAIEAAKWVTSVYEPLIRSADAAATWAHTMESLLKPFDEAIAKAKEYGLEVQGIEAARDRAFERLLEGRVIDSGSMQANLWTRQAQANENPRALFAAQRQSLDYAGQRQRRELEDFLLANGITGEWAAGLRRDLDSALSAEASKLARDFERQQQSVRDALSDRMFAATNDGGTLEGALAAFDRAAAREREDAARAGLVDMVELERVQAAERLKVIREFGTNSVDALKAAGESIRDYLIRLRTTDAGGMSATDQLTNARGVFDTSLAKAQLGDADALAAIAQQADAMLTAARQVYASGQGFTSLRDWVMDQLNALTVQTTGIPAFANGGLASGLALVGEQGPELARFVQPARIYTAAETRSVMRGGSDSDSAAVMELRAVRREMAQMRGELARLRDQAGRIAESAADTAATNRRMMDDAPRRQTVVR